MKPTPETPHYIKYQGAVAVHFATVQVQDPRLVAIDIALVTKYAEVGAGISLADPKGSDRRCPGLALHATERSVLVNPGKPRADITGIIFTDFPGWEVYATATFKSTVRVVLIAPEA